jgi:hypothetical protein
MSCIICEIKDFRETEGEELLTTHITSTSNYSAEGRWEKSDLGSIVNPAQDTDCGGELSLWGGAEWGQKIREKYITCMLGYVVKYSQCVQFSLVVYTKNLQKHIMSERKL